MSHLDEGQIHTLLDGELSPAERIQAEEHLGGCAECRQLLAEAQAFFAEADRLVNSVVPPARMVPEIAGSPRARSAMGRYRWIAWAATVVLAVGLGYYGSALRYPGAAEQERTSADAKTANEATAVPGQTSPPAAGLADRAEKNEPSAAAGPGDKETRRQAPVETAQTPAPSVPPPEAAGAIAGQRKDEDLQRRNERDSEPVAPGRLAEEPLPKPQVLNSEIVAGFQAASLEDAVRVLGGSVQLIDGLTPEMVLIGPGSDMSGGREDRKLIRVVYQDPPGRQLWLDQQRIEPEDDRASAFTATASKVSVLPGDTLVAPTAQGASTLSWTSQSMFRLSLTGYLSADSLRSLARRVR
jgi:anti-sigma factor RsiW